MSPQKKQVYITQTEYIIKELLEIIVVHSIQAYLLQRIEGQIQGNFRVCSNMLQFFYTI